MLLNSIVLFPINRLNNSIVFENISEKIIKKINLNNWYKKQYALVIGISKYKNSSINHIPNATNDADAIAQFLREQSVDVTVLKNSEATKKNILKTITKIKKKLSKDDSILVYFAGHGKGISLESHKRVGYIIPYDFDSNLNSKDLPDYDNYAITTPTN